MTFEEWWLKLLAAYPGHPKPGPSEAALAQAAWQAAQSIEREQQQKKWNRVGLDIDAALRGHVNEDSPIANRLRMIAAARPGWRPIATAPKDGRRVLVYQKGFGIETMFAGYVPCSITPSMSGFYLADSCGVKLKPTHWMPLPHPPEGAP